MPVTGPKPVADRAQVVHRNKPAEGAEWTEVVDLPHDGPRLGDRPESPGILSDRPLGMVASWPAATLEWWEAVRTMPHAALWSRAEWATAMSAAEAHARFVEGWKGCSSGAEVRQREKLLGMTADARRDLRIRYVPAPDPEADLPANVTRIDFGTL